MTLKKWQWLRCPWQPSSLAEPLRWRSRPEGARRMVSPLAFACTLLILLPNPVNVLAQPASSSPNKPKLQSNQTPRNLKRKVTHLKFKLPPKGAPGKRADAGSRSGCPVLDECLVALVPATNIGLTIAERPTFWFYVPYQPSAKSFGKFQLLNEQQKVIYETSTRIIGTPGIIGINLPRPLETNKRYQWVFSFIYDTDATVDASVSVNGSVKRISLAPELRKKLESAKTPQQKMLLYADNGLWYDLLTTLIKERRQKPQDVQLTNNWKELLEQSPEVELNELVTEPIVF